VLPKPTDASQTSSVVRRLEALFRLEDSSIRGTLQRLPDTAESNGKLALDALSLAQTDEAQDALAEVAQGPAYSALHREYAIRYLGHQQAPTAASLAALRLLVDDRDPKRRQLARLAYGTLAARVASKQPEQSHQMVQCLIDRLRTASDDSERADLQLALGNSASRQAFSPLRDATMKHTGVLRATAIEAVGNIDDPAVVPLLGDLLKSEQVEVRMAALNGVQRRELGPFLPALVEIAKRDKSAHVRSAAVELLGSQLASVPQLRDVLAECSKDSDMKVRNAAMRQLSLIARPRAG
jgi:HEAT repeat protein